MDALRLFRIVYYVARKNNINVIPVPKQPFNNISRKNFIENAEKFLIYPESFRNNNISTNKKSEPVIIFNNLNTINLNEKNIDLNKSKKYFGTYN